MKTILILLLLSCAGCCNLHKVVQALAKDPATAGFSVQTIYGTVYFVRTVNTNQQIIFGPITIK